MTLYCVFNLGSVFSVLSGKTFFHKSKFFMVLAVKRVIRKEAHMALAYSGSRGLTVSEAPRA